MGYVCSKYFLLIHFHELKDIDDLAISKYFLLIHFPELNDINDLAFST